MSRQIWLLRLVWLYVISVIILSARDFKLYSSNQSFSNNYIIQLIILENSRKNKHLNMNISKSIFFIETKSEKRWKIMIWIQGSFEALYFWYASIVFFTFVVLSNRTVWKISVEMKIKSRIYWSINFRRFDEEWLRCINLIMILKTYHYIAISNIFHQFFLSIYSTLSKCYITLILNELSQSCPHICFYALQTARWVAHKIVCGICQFPHCLA